MGVRFNILLVSALLLPWPAMGQVLCALGSDAVSYNAYKDERPSPDAMQLAGQVNAALKPLCTPNCPAVAVFRNITAPNAMLVVASGQAKVVYAPQFFTALYDRFGDGAIIAIIAHEIGHAIDEVLQARWLNAAWTSELRADAWAGCALSKVKLSSVGLAGTLTALSTHPPPAAPPWPQRLQALRVGYTRCGGDGSRLDRGKP